MGERVRVAELAERRGLRNGKCPGAIEGAIRSAVSQATNPLVDPGRPNYLQFGFLDCKYISRYPIEGIYYCIFLPSLSDCPSCQCSLPY